MAFPIDGRNHKESIHVEKNITHYQNKFEKFYNKKVSTIIHRGGTKTVVDFEIIFEDGTILHKSLKKKINIKSGSFDYLNTSDFPKELIPNSNLIYQLFKGKNIKSKYEDLRLAISKDLSSMTSEVITNLFMTKVINKYDKINGLDIVETTTNNIFINVNPWFFDVIKKGGYLKINNTGKVTMSYKLSLFDKNHVIQKESGLRIRLHLNNGKGKWLSGDSSQLVIKFQQDNISKIIK